MHRQLRLLPRLTADPDGLSESTQRISIPVRIVKRRFALVIPHKPSWHSHW